MSYTMRIALNFSGRDVFEQQESAEVLLAQVSTDEHDVRARLLAILAAARVFTDPDAAADAARKSAHEAAKAGGAVARAWSLLAACVVDLSCAATEQRLSMTLEVLEIAQHSGESSIVPSAYFLHLAALAELGQIAELDQALCPVGPLMSTFPWLNDGRHVAWFRCLRATLDGHIETAEQMAHRAYAVALESNDPDAQSVRVGQLAIIRWIQGRVEELEPAFLVARQLAPHEPIWAVSLAWMWLRQGRRSAAQALIFALPPIAELPVDRNWLSTSCILAVVAAELDELALAQELHDALLPFEDRLMTIGLGVTCWGTVARPLGLLAAALGDAEAAISHYRNAVECAARVGAHPWLAEAQWELAELLAHRCQPGDHDEALFLAAEAAATGRALQLHGIEGAASTVLASLKPATRGGLAQTRPSVPRRAPRITVLGDFAVTSAEGTVARWQSRKARQLLKILVARRGAAVSRETVMHLLWPDESAQRLANRFSVATTVVRRALDPTGTLPGDTYLDSSEGLIRLRLDAVRVDVEEFLTEANAALVSTAPEATRRERLRDVLASYHGDPLTDDQEELWAAELRREAHIVFFAAAHALAESSAAADDHLTPIETYRRILALDGYDQRAHERLIEALARVGSHGQAAAARVEYSLRMEALGIPTRRDDPPSAQQSRPPRAPR
ncbi:AfsR/SARP family transcriptional regulator [Microbacterium terregens]|uniref:BTAD domain-containing putative transcriptional regulator n=1 Tax=Microbacterium terregens TaxID=69363 RepID=A0ABV5SYI2_9MICO